MFTHRFYLSHLTSVFSLSLLITSFCFCIPAFAQQSLLKNPPVKKFVPKKTVPANANQFIDIRFESVEIITISDNTHQWQVNVRNYSNKAIKNFKIHVQAFGFRAEDKSELMLVNIPLLQANSSGFARGPLPRFPGVHRLAVKVGGPYVNVQIPRPFRNDRNGHPEDGLEVNRVWYRVINGKVRWYLETKPNVYADVPAGKINVSAKIRGRFKNYCHEEESDIQIYDNSDGYPVTNTVPIRTGKKYVFSSEIVTVNSEEYPNVYDNLILVFHGKRYWIEMPPSLYNNWKKCDQNMQYLK